MKITALSFATHFSNVFFLTGNCSNASSFVFNESAFPDKIKQTKKDVIVFWRHDEREIMLFASNNSQEKWKIHVPIRALLLP